ncbi:calcium-activated chloride channel regulator 4A-like [Branchiostoma floridae x Branchiostoma japonicum]
MTKMITIRWLLLLSALVWYSQAVLNQPNEIKLQNNGYTDVLIAINKVIPEDGNIIHRLKEVFTEASEELYSATKNRAFFKEIKILIPKTWSKKEGYLLAGTETFERANIRVDLPNPLLASRPDNPYVWLIDGCGYPGVYMHLTPDYLVKKQYAVLNWGPYGKTIVHEWGHLRWGVFDEYPLPGYPRFYRASTGGVKPTQCSAKIPGYSRNDVNYLPCRMNYSSGIYEEDCYFYVDRQINEATGSYMCKPTLTEVTDFCHSDPGGDPLSYHNREAPNMHNAMCQLQSTWDVMNKHRDFASGANPPRAAISTQPSFILLQENEPRIVLVLDISATMEGGPIRRLSQVATRFIRNAVPFGTSLGIAIFSSDAILTHPVVRVNSTAVRDNLIATIPLNTSGSTCIGCGLLKAIEALEAVGPPQGGRILLVTAGQENGDPRIRDVIPDLRRKKVIVDTIAYGRDADPLLQSLAQETGGDSFFSGIQDSTALDTAFTATFGAKLVKLLSEDKTVSGKQTYTTHVYVDSSVGENTFFSVSWLNGHRPMVILETPLGRMITEDDPMYDVTSESITIEIQGTATPGKWSLSVTNTDSDDQDITIIVTSNSGNGNEPIQVTTQVSDDLLNYSSSQPAALRIFATVMKCRYLPIRGAVVKVNIVKPPHGEVDEVTLMDNGAGADSMKDDGIYSRYFFNFTADGRYGVSVRVDNSHGDAEYVFMSSARGSYRGAPVDSDTANALESIVQKQERVEQFQRITTGGVFEVQGVPSGGVPTQDIIPPSRVDDLKVEEVSYAEATVTLSWTALGDDFDHGGPAQYVDIRYARHFDELADDFQGSASVNHSQVLLGSLTSPPEPSSMQTIMILVPDRGDNVMFVFAVRMCDDVDNCGDPSNIVAANLEYIPDPTNKFPWHIVRPVLITIGVLALIFVISCIVWKCKKPSKSTQPSANENIV